MDTQLQKEASVSTTPKNMEIWDPSWLFAHRTHESHKLLDDCVIKTCLKDAYLSVSKVFLYFGFLQVKKQTSIWLHCDATKYSKVDTVLNLLCYLKMWLFKCKLRTRMAHLIHANRHLVSSLNFMLTSVFVHLSAKPLVLTQNAS